MNQNAQKRINEFWEVVRFVATVLIIVIPIRIFIAQPFIVNGESMFPTFGNGDYLIVDQLSYRLKQEPKRGDIIVFQLPNNKKRFLIKRVIGLPGEKVIINNSSVRIIDVNNKEKTIEEPYIQNGFTTKNKRIWDLGKEEYFVLGDNRNSSSDSRIWGVLPRNLIIGKAFMRIFPIQDFTYNPGATSYLDSLE